MSGSVSGLSNGGVDPSIPLQAGRGVPQANPLASIGQFAGAANSLNQLKLFPGQMQLQQQAIQGGATSLAQQQLRAAAGALIPILGKDRITFNDVTTGLASAEGNLGIVTQPFLKHLVDNAPAPDSPEYDPYIRRVVGTLSQGSPETAVAALGHPTVQTNNAENIPGWTGGIASPTPGAFNPAGQSIPLKLSPSEETTPTTIGVVPSGPNAGAPITGTRRQFINQTAAPSPLGTGRLPPALRNPAAATPDSAAPPGGSAPSPPAEQPPGGGVVTTLGPAKTAALTTAGTQSAQAFQGIAEQGVQAKAQTAILDNMLGDTDQFVSGPGTEGIKNFKAVVQRFAPGTAKVFGIDPDSLAANESFDKLANQLANAQGAGSDARLAVNQGSNPSSIRTPAGVNLIIRQLQGNSDYLGVRAKLAAEYPDQTDRPGFEASIASNLDPRVFQYNRLTPEQKVTFFNTMKNKDSFIKAYTWAESHHLVVPNQ